MAIEDGKLLELYKKMLLARRMEEKHEYLLKEGKCPTFGHFSTGSEAVGVGAMGALSKDDVMIGSHRGFSEYIGKGMDPKDLWAEYLCKKNVLDGKAGIQVSDKGNNIPGMSACIGGMFAIAVGMAYAIKYKGEDRVVVVSYGDGGYNQADAHPSMIMASSWKLPLIFHVANNGYAQYTPTEEFLPTKNIAARGAAYNIPAQSIDGQRVDLVYEASQKAVDHARSGKGPYLLEYMTHRQCLHFTGDRGGYVDVVKRREWAKRDPIDLGRKLLIEKGIISEKDIDNLNREIEDIVEESLNHALNLPSSDINDLSSNVYASMDW